MKNEIREQLRLLAKQVIEEDTLQATQIKEAALELYNKSAILEFLEKQENEPIHSNIQDSLDLKILQEESSIENPESSSSKIEDITEKIEEEKFQAEDKPNTENLKIENQEEPLSKPAINELEQFASEFQNMPEFERKVPQTSSNSDRKNIIHKKLEATKPKSLNDIINQGLNIGLNDRLAFINHLFEGQTEDYTRVLSQISTLHSFEEAKEFIEDQVKPDYNNWQNKDEFSKRFMAIIEKTFS